MDERLFPRLNLISNQRLVATFDKAPDQFLLKRLAKYKGATVEIIIHDPRLISADQRKKAYALMGDIDDHYMGNYDIEITKAQLKNEFVERDLGQMFSLSNCSMDEARKFIEFLIDFSVENGVQLDNSIDLIRGDYALEYSAIKYHKCVICGRRADIAHVETVGSGSNRNHISHIGKRVMALCRDHHVEQHTVGIDTFMHEHYLKGIKVDADIARMLKLGNWHVVEEDDEGGTND